MEALGKAKFETTEQISSQVKDVILRKSPTFCLPQSLIDWLAFHIIRKNTVTIVSVMDKK